LLFADENNLADVVSIVGADVREHLGGLLQLGFVGGFHPFFKFAYDVVELFYGFIPSLAVKFVEGLVITAGEFFEFFSFEVREIPSIPEHQMVGKLADRVISFAVGPIGLLGGQAFHGGIRGHEPFGVGVWSAVPPAALLAEWPVSCLELEGAMERAQKRKQPKATAEKSAFA
jgi:hypothetical protein